MPNIDAENSAGQDVKITDDQHPENTAEPLVYNVHVSFEYIFNVKAYSFDEALDKIRQLPMGEHITKNKSSLLQTISLDKWKTFNRDLDA